MSKVFLEPHDHPPFRWHLEVELHDGAKRFFRTIEEFNDWYHPGWEDELVSTSAIFPDIEGKAVVWIRPDYTRAALAERMRLEHGWRTLAEVDDNYVSREKLNIALRTAGWDDEQRKLHLEAMCSNDAIVFSTDLLRDLYWPKIKERFAKKEIPNLELHVCRNHVPDHVWPERVERNGPIRVGWMGSPSHVWDVDLAYYALRAAKENGAETWMVGFNPMTDVVADTERTRWKHHQWFKVGYRHVPWRMPAKFERFALPFDIGLCPLLTNANTLGKSDVKAIEYTISGAAVVAQNNAVYNKTFKHGETALLVGSPIEMMDATLRLMKDKKLRETLVANAQQYVREERGEKQLREEWMNAISG